MRSTKWAVIIRGLLDFISLLSSYSSSSAHCSLLLNLMYCLSHANLGEGVCLVIWKNHDNQNRLKWDDAFSGCSILPAFVSRLNMKQSFLHSCSWCTSNWRNEWIESNFLWLPCVWTFLSSCGWLAACKRVWPSVSKLFKSSHCMIEIFHQAN